MSSRIREISDGILGGVGGKDNIINFDNCMTRVRIILKDRSKLDKAKLKKMEDVIGIIESGRQVQVVVGPSVATKVVEHMRKDTKIGVRDIPEFKANREEIRAKVKEKYNQPLSRVFKMIAGRFKPQKNR